MRYAPETFAVRQEQRSNPLSLESYPIGHCQLGMVVLGEKTFFPDFQWPIFNSQYPAPLRREGAYAATHKKAPFRVAHLNQSNFRQGDLTMRTRIAFLSFCLVMTTMAWAADINSQGRGELLYRRDMALVWTSDVSGKWTAQVPGRDGQLQETTFTFKVEGDKLTGAVSGRQGDTPIADGKVSGDEISFTVTRERQGNVIKQLYKGKVSGDEIKFTRSVEGGQGDRPPVEFTAKKAK
jgi:hypothetical protein